MAGDKDYGKTKQSKGHCKHDIWSEQHWIAVFNRMVRVDLPEEVTPQQKVKSER